jgi:ATP-binding cassette subfamily C protein LapB
MPTSEENDLHILSENRKIDTLLESLVFLTKYYQRATSRATLVSGFALDKDIMTIRDFTESAKRVSLITKVVHRKIDEIARLALPSVLILDNNSACVLLDFSLEKNEAKVIMPEISEGEITISLDELNKRYQNKVLIIKPAYDFRNRISDEIKIDEPRKWFFGTMKRNMFIYKKVIIAAIIINLFVLATPLFMKNVFDRVLPNNGIETLWAMTFGMAIIMIFDFILKLIRSYYLGVAGKRADTVMSNKIFNQVLSIKLDEKPSSTGQFVSRLQSFESVRDFFTSATIVALVDVPFIILFLGIIFFFSGALGWIPIAAIIIILIFSVFIQKKTKGLSEKSSKEDQLKQTTLHETVSGLEVIKSIGAYSRMKSHWDQALIQTTYFNEKLQFLSQLNSIFTALVSQAANIAIIIVGVYMAIEGDVSMGGIIAAMMLTGKVLGPLGQIVGMVLRYDKAMIALKNIDEIMEMEVEKSGTGLLSRPNLKGDIEFKDVCFTYKGQNNPTLKNVNLKIKQGEKIAILGKIGSGKSTITKLIMNLYTPASGSILIDRTDIRQISPSDLRQAVGCVPQEAFLFMGTIKDNITVSQQYVTDEEVIAAAKLAGVHDFLGKHESGYDLVVGERGEGLSGGEKQSVTLARALISNPSILIMDEPTNSMDKQAEVQFIKRMQSIQREDQTLIIVTHKTSLLKLVDRVIIIDEGKIVADGPKEKVLAPKK